MNVVTYIYNSIFYFSHPVCGEARSYGVHYFLVKLSVEYVPLNLYLGSCIGDIIKVFYNKLVPNLNYHHRPSYLISGEHVSPDGTVIKRFDWSDLPRIEEFEAVFSRQLGMGMTAARSSFFFGGSNYNAAIEKVTTIMCDVINYTIINGMQAGYQIFRVEAPDKTASQFFMLGVSESIISREEFEAACVPIVMATNAILRDEQSGLYLPMGNEGGTN